MLKVLNSPFFDKWYTKIFSSLLINFIISFIFVFLFGVVYNIISFSNVIDFSLIFSSFLSIATISWFFLHKIFIKLNFTAHKHRNVLFVIWLLLFYEFSGCFFGIFLRSLFPTLEQFLFKVIISSLLYTLEFFSINVSFFNTILEFIEKYSDMINVSILFMFFASFLSFYINTYYLAEIKNTIPLSSLYQKYILEKLGIR